MVQLCQLGFFYSYLGVFVKFKTVTLSFLVAIGALTSIPAFADDDHDEIVAQQVAKISLQQAKAIAIKAVGGGIVVDIDFDTSAKYKGGYYDVEVQKDRTAYDVKIDANTGKVIKKKIDH